MKVKSKNKSKNVYKRQQNRKNFIDLKDLKGQKQNGYLIENTLEA